jgi:type IV pilus assembly protein PilX
MKRQKGVVLFFALIVLIIMTVIGVALAVNSTQSLRMSGAGSERLEAKALADGGVAALLLDKPQSYFANLSDIDSDNNYLDPNPDEPWQVVQVVTPLPFVDDGTGNLVVQPKNVSCQRTANATGANLVNCRRVEISSTTTFGRDNLGQLTVVAGVEQQVLP